MSIGISEDEFWGMNPRRIKLHIEAFKIEQKRRDEWIWSICGSYVLSAVSVAVEHCLAGKKAKLKYIEQPIMSELESKLEKPKEIELTEEEKKRQTEQLFLKLRIMGANFNNKKKRDDKNGTAKGN